MADDDIILEEDVNDTDGQGNPMDGIGESDTDNEPNTRFLTNILYEDNGSVYGLEVLLFDIHNNPIETILVVDETSFDSWTELTKQMQEAVVPYTKNDADLLNDIKEEREKVGKKVIVNGVERDYTYQDFKNFLDDLNVEGNEKQWSNLKKLGSLEEVLKNESQEVSENGSLVKKYPVKINATTFMDMTSDMFSKVGHDHNYAEKPHASSDTSYGIGDANVYGHVKTINNLATDENRIGEALSAYQGHVLDEKITGLTNDFKNSWSTVVTIDKYLSYKVNTSLRLIVCNYSRSDYTGLSSKTGSRELYVKGTIPNAYAPSNRVHTPLYRGDVVLYFNKDGSVKVYNLTKIKKMNLNAQVMWHY